jgi:hypothetical protein
MMNMVWVILKDYLVMRVDILQSDFDDVLSRNMMIDLNFVHNDQSLDDIESN